MPQEPLTAAHRRTLLGSISISGFASLLAQILLIRELLVVFDGLEICIGVMLASWMLLVALGSWLVGRITDFLPLGEGTLLGTQWLMAGLIPGTLLSARLVKAALGLAVYDLVDFPSLAGATLVLLAPLGFLVGFQFALICHLLTAQPERADVELGRVYLFETLGALGAGFLFSFALVFLGSPLSIAWGASLLNLIAAGGVWATGRGRWPSWRQVIFLAGSLALGGAWVIAVTRGAALEQAVWQRQWGDFRLVETHYSRYGHLAVTELEEQYTFYENGLRLFSLPAIMTPEELAHYSLLEHPHPRDVLLIGGGVNGLVREVLRHDVKRVGYVELDPQIIATAQPYLSAEDRQALADPRVEVYENLDGRLFVKRVRQPFDVILVDLPDPSTAQLNRFYTVEFCREARRALNVDGILALSLSSGENYLGPETQLLNACLARTLRQVFAEVVVLPGDSALFLACPTRGVLTTDPEVLAARFRERALTPTYLTEYNFLLRMTPERMEWLQERLAEVRNVKLNRDFFPICYYYAWLRWAAQFSQRDEASARRAERFLALATDLRVWWLALPLAIVGLGRLLARCYPPLARKASLPHRVAWTLFCSGFGGIALEMLLIFAFQSLYGYVYSQVSLLIAAFMFGLLLGTQAMNHILQRVPTDFRAARLLARLQLAFTFYALMLPLVLLGLAHLTHRDLLFLVVPVLFPALVAIAGALVGAEFPLASHICLRESTSRPGRTGGSLYAADLLGACCGAFLVSALLLPLLGLPQTCLGTALLMGSAVLGLGGGAGNPSGER